MWPTSQHHWKHLQSSGDYNLASPGSFAPRSQYATVRCPGRLQVSAQQMSLLLVRRRGKEPLPCRQKRCGRHASSRQNYRTLVSVHRLQSCLQHNNETCAPPCFAFASKRDRKWHDSRATNEAFVIDRLPIGNKRQRRKGFVVRDLQHLFLGSTLPRADLRKG